MNAAAEVNENRVFTSIFSYFEKAGGLFLINSIIRTKKTHKFVHIINSKNLCNRISFSNNRGKAE